MLAPLVLAAVLCLPPDYFHALTALLVAYAAFEWAGLSGCRFTWQKLYYVAGIGLLVGLVSLESAMTLPVLIIGSLWWLLAVFLVARYPQTDWLHKSAATGLIAGVLVLLPAWVGLGWLHLQNIWLVLYLFLLVWGADIGAYFAGHAIGRHKLAPHISPGKTIEGVAGGLLAGLLVAAVFGFWILTIESWPVFLAFSAFLVLISVLGDLMESTMKRAQGLKDSGAVLPGHGGLLDRIDALLAVSPVLALAHFLNVGLV